MHFVRIQIVCVFLRKKKDKETGRKEEKESLSCLMETLDFSHVWKSSIYP